MNRIVKIVVLIALITCIVSISGSYAATTYAISASKIGYSDNSNLGVNNVQAAIDGTCNRINTQLSVIDNKLEPHKNIVSDFNSGYTLIDDSRHNNYYAKISSFVIVNIGVMVKSPSTNIVFSLPEEYRPSQQVDEIIWQESSIDSVALLTVMPNGNVILRETRGETITDAKVIGTIMYAI